MASVEIAADFAVCVAGSVAAYALATLATGVVLPEEAIRNATPLGAALGLIVITLFYHDGCYRSSGGLLRIRETERAIRIPAQAVLLLLAIRVLLGFDTFWLAFLVALFVIPMLLILVKQLFSSIVTRVQRVQEGFCRAVIYGSGELGRRVASILLQSPRLSLDPVTVIDDGSAHGEQSVLEMGYRGRRSISIERQPLSASVLTAHRCEMLLVAAPDLSAEERTIAIQAAQQTGSDIALPRDSGFSDGPTAETINMDDLLFSSSRERPSLWLYTISKRITDIFVSAVLIVLLAPLLALIAILVRLDSPGPALFVQKRAGRNGELFEMFKFRSMFADAPRYAKSPATSSDPRITRVGRLLRRLSLDELPQLLNVLIGTMSLVGPRPEMPYIVESYDDRQRQRLKVPPGITGLWQLSADRAFPIHQNLEYDFYYVRNRSWCMDAAILVHTLVFALCGGV